MELSIQDILMNGTGINIRNILMKSADDTVGGIFSTVAKHCVRRENRLSCKKD